MRILEGDVKMGQLSAVLFGMGILYFGIFIGKKMTERDIEKETK